MAKMTEGRGKERGKKHTCLHDHCNSCLSNAQAQQWLQHVHVHVHVRE